MPSHKGPSTVDKLESIPVGADCPGAQLKIGSQLSEPYNSELITFLLVNSDEVAWSHEDMVGIDPRHAVIDSI
ncbi:hypothetical protein ACS0TY_018350 [Phlomoides rotata]